MYAKIDSLIINLGFKLCESNHILYAFCVHGDTLIVSMYVDDLFIIGNNLDLIIWLKRQLVDSIEIIDLGIPHFFLFLQVFPFPNGIFISWCKYSLDLLKFFKMDDYKMIATPFQSGVKLTKECQSLKVTTTLYQQLVGSLIYLTHSQPWISFTISVISRFMQDPW